MSDQEKDNKEFEFIKELVVESKRKKLKKWIFPPLFTLLLAIIFGLTASLTIILAEPRLKKLFQNKDNRQEVYFPNDNTSGSITPTQKATGSVTPKPSATPTVSATYRPDIDDYVSMNNNIKEIASSVSKSILNIKSKFNTEDWLFGKSVVKTVNSTGIIMFNNGEELIVLVSLDRVKDANSIKVVLNDLISVNAKIQDYESELNLAMIAVPINEIPPVYMKELEVAKLGESYSLNAGNPIIALGSPNGHPGSMEYGMITSRGGSACIVDNEMDLFNTNIIDNKNGDGIIVDFKGQIIGVITQALKEKGYEDLNTAIGISKLKPIIIAMGNKTPRIYCGVRTDDLTSETKAQYGVGNGIYVKDVLADSPAFKAGIQNGDIILQVNEGNILGTSNFFEKINNYSVGERVEFKILRTVKEKDTTTLTLPVVLVQKKK